MLYETKKLIYFYQLIPTTEFQVQSDIHFGAFVSMQNLVGVQNQNGAGDTGE